jgi:hypothetical protein
VEAQAPEWNPSVFFSVDHHTACKCDLKPAKIRPTDIDPASELEGVLSLNDIPHAAMFLFTPRQGDLQTPSCPARRPEQMLTGKSKEGIHSGSRRSRLGDIELFRAVVCAMSNIWVDEKMYEVILIFSAKDSSYRENEADS